MKRYAMLFTMAIGIGFGAEKTVAPVTVEQAQAAYDSSVAWISARLKAPSTAHFQPIEEVGFCGDCRVLIYRHRIGVRMWVDAQNSFGAMLRHTWVCGVDRQNTSKVVCFDLSK